MRDAHWFTKRAEIKTKDQIIAELLQALKYARAMIPKPSMTDKDAAMKAATLVAIDEAIDSAEGES